MGSTNIWLTYRPHAAQHNNVPENRYIKALTHKQTSCRHKAKQTKQRLKGVSEKLQQHLQLWQQQQALKAFVMKNQ